MTKDRDKLGGRRTSSRYKGATPGRIARAMFKKKGEPRKTTEPRKPE